MLPTLRSRTTGVDRPVDLATTEPNQSQPRGAPHAPTPTFPMNKGSSHQADRPSSMAAILGTFNETSFLPSGASRTARLAVGVRTTGNTSSAEIHSATGQAARDALAKLPNPRPTGWVDVDITVQRFGGPRLAPLLFAKDYR